MSLNIHLSIAIIIFVNSYKCIIIEINVRTKNKKNTKLHKNALLIPTSLKNILRT